VTAGPTARIAGVRPPPTSPLWAGGRLHFADAGRLALVPGDWVVVDGPGAPWVGEVVVAPEQVVDAPPTVRAPPTGPLLRVLRPAGDVERPPARAECAGLTVFRSLDLPDWATLPRSAPPASVRLAPATEQD